MANWDYRWQPGDELPPPIHVAVTGAAGRVAYGLVFRIAAGDLFGPQQPVSLRLLDVEKSQSQLEATRLELHDCGFPLLSELRFGANADEVLAGADWIIMLACAPRTQAEVSRMELVRDNAPLYAEHGRAINRVAAKARVLVVAEPCNTNCLVALGSAPNVPAEHWFAMNRLARMRAAALIARKARVPINRVNRVAVWGNHSAKIFVDFHNTYIGETPARQIITAPDWPRDVLESAVAGRESEISRLRGSTPSSTATEAILGTIRSITTPTQFRRRFGAAVCSEGSYGIPRGLVFGLPLRTEDGRSWSIVEGLYLDDYAELRLRENVEDLEHEAFIAGVAV